MVEITEKGAQRPAHQLPSSRAPILGVALDVADHVLLTDLAQVVVTGGAHLVQEPADDREMADDGLRSQAALCPQIGIELFEDPIVRGERRQHCRRDHAFLTQHRQPSLERGPVAGLDGLPPSPVPEVSLDHALIEGSQRPATTFHPTQEPADHIETPPSAMANEAVFYETCGEALDRLTMRPALETPEQPASIIFDFHRPVLRC